MSDPEFVDWEKAKEATDEDRRHLAAYETAARALWRGGHGTQLSDDVLTAATNYVIREAFAKLLVEMLDDGRGALRYDEDERVLSYLLRPDNAEAPMPMPVLRLSKRGKVTYL